MSTRIEASRDRRLVVAALFVVPAAVFVGANVLEHELGVAGAATWLDRGLESGLGWIVTVLVVAGPIAALLLATTRLLLIRSRRDDDAWEVRVRIRTGRWAIGVAAVSVALGVILAGYLLLENLACLTGTAERC